MIVMIIIIIRIIMMMPIIMMMIIVNNTSMTIYKVCEGNFKEKKKNKQKVNWRTMEVNGRATMF